MIRLLPVLFLGIAGCGTQTSTELPEGIRATLMEADRFEIVALDPYGIDYDGVSTDEVDDLHGYEILRRAEVEDSRLCEEIVGLFEQGIREVASDEPECFNPRHGLLAWRGERAVELLICYECSSFLIYTNGRFEAQGTTGRSPEPRMTAIWNSLGCDVAD